LNRLSTMADSATPQVCKGLLWAYDAWGNRTDQSVTAGSCGTFHATAGTNNRLSSTPYQYDPAGNMTSDGSHAYTYDAENRLIAVDGGSAAAYLYDAEGHRVIKSTPAAWRSYIYDATGGVVAETNAAGWDIGYVYFNGSLLAEYRDGTTYFIHDDHLGSTRLLSRLDKTILDSIDYLPFGEQIAGDTGTTHKFTGKERDAESNLDNFSARYESSIVGRFMSPDWSSTPEPIPFADLSHPQSLNLYSYVENNPINRIDDGGHTGKESLPGTSYRILQHRDNPNDMPNVHVYDKKGNEVGELRYNGRGGFDWDKNSSQLSSEIKQQVVEITRTEGYSAAAIERQAAMNAVRASR